MTIRKRLDDSECRRFWESVEEGARRYAELPEWKKGDLAPWPSGDGESGPALAESTTCDEARTES